MLGRPPLTLLLSAQAAQLDGDDEAATGTFRSHAGAAGDRVPGPARPDGRGDAARRPRGRPGVMPGAPMRSGPTRSGRPRRCSAANPRRRLEGGAAHLGGGRRTAGGRQPAGQAPPRGRADRAGAQRAARPRPGRRAAAGARGPCRGAGAGPGAVLLAGLLGRRAEVAPGRQDDREELGADTPSRAGRASCAPGATKPGRALYRRLEKLVAAAPNALGESHIAAARAALDAELTGEARRHLDAAGEDVAGPAWRVCGSSLRRRTATPSGPGPGCAGPPRRGRSRSGIAVAACTSPRTGARCVNPAAPST